MSTKQENGFGGALETALAMVVAESAASSISVAEAGTPETFLDSWAQILSDHGKYLKLNSMTLSAPVVLSYVPDMGAFEKRSQWMRRPMLGTTHRENFGGILAVGTGETGACVYSNQLSKTEEFEREIRNVDLQSAPTIALMTESRLLVWPHGIDGAALPFRNLDKNGIAINLKAIDDVLKKFYESVARQTKEWWKNTKLRVTVEKPETTVQYALWVFLLSKFGDVARVKKEENIGNGRADITILPIRPTEKDFSSVLELKALRDVRTPQDNEATPTKISVKENITWACSGIQQTAAYRDDNTMDFAFLCLYDFCAGNRADFEEEVKPYAVKYQVQYRRYWISASHDEHREERYPL